MKTPRNIELGDQSNFTLGDAILLQNSSEAVLIFKMFKSFGVNCKFSRTTALQT